MSAHAESLAFGLAYYGLRMRAGSLIPQEDPHELSKPFSFCVWIVWDYPHYATLADWLLPTLPDALKLAGPT